MPATLNFRVKLLHAIRKPLSHFAYQHSPHNLNRTESRTVRWPVDRFNASLHKVLALLSSYEPEHYLAVT